MGKHTGTSEKASLIGIHSRPVVTIELAYQQQPSNIPGMTYVGLKVTAPVGAATPPHRHGGAAVVANMVKGRMLNQMVCDGQSHGPKIYSEGESWYEPPGCHHVRSENAGDEEAVFIANLIIETKKIEELGILNALVQIDADEEEKKDKESL
jgi:quercetin dioxygenase-like cupin family protein